jgi:hypothetical protein
MDWPYVGNTEVQSEFERGDHSLEGLVRRKDSKKTKFG